MNSYSFAPSPLEEQRRKTYISHALAQKLPSSGSWPRFLPPELWVMVARFLVRECAAVAAQAQAQGCGDTLTGFLNLSRPVYASYVKTNGCYYVKTLRNHARTDASETTYLLLPRTYTNRYASSRRNSGKDMLVAEDHLGIRRVIFLDSNQRKSWCRNPPSVPGAWWRRISWSWYTTAPRLITVNDVSNPSQQCIQTNTTVGLQGAKSGGTRMYRFAGFHSVANSIERRTDCGQRL